MDAKAWLEANRCPHCVKRGDPRTCGNVVKRAHDGWRCCGYSSRHWDERTWER